MKLWLAAFAFAGTLAGLFWAYGRHTPLPETFVCTTGAGPTVIEGFDVRERINPFLSEVHEIVWRREARDINLSSAALQPPASCHKL